MRTMRGIVVDDVPTRVFARDGDERVVVIYPRAHPSSSSPARVVSDVGARVVARTRLVIRGRRHG